MYVETVDHWIAFGLLAFLGIRMIRSGLLVTWPPGYSKMYSGLPVAQE